MPQQVLEFQKRDTLLKQMAHRGVTKHSRRKGTPQCHSFSGCVQNPMNLRLREGRSLLREEDRGRLVSRFDQVA